MREVKINGHAVLWTDLIQKKFNSLSADAFSLQDFKPILSKYAAVADYPAAIFPSELLASYPNAHVILTTRSEDGWFTSMEQTLIHSFAARRQRELATQKEDNTSPPPPMVALAQAYCQACWGDDFAANGRALFRSHNATVRAATAAMRRPLLEYHPGDGWEPLCAFLGLEVPPGLPFPSTDDWAEYKKKVIAEEMTRMNG